MLASTPKDYEFKLNIWVKPEDDTMVRTYTVSLGKRGICIDMPIDEALDAIRQEMEND